jgi:hypothetical protein
MLAGKCPLKDRLDPVGLLLICVVACRSEWAVIAPRSSSLDAKMCADPEYLRSWRDLRSRELLFWFFVLSYVPGILLIIIVVNVFNHDVPEHIGIYFSGAWLAGFLGTSLYCQNFRCPRCRNFFFRRFRFVEPYARNCVNCNLASGALGP